MAKGLGIFHLGLWVLTMLWYNVEPRVIVVAINAMWACWALAAVWAVRVVWVEKRRCARVNNATFDWRAALSMMLGMLFLGRVVTIVGDLAMLYFYLDAIHIIVDM
mgnify:FL=1